MKKRKPLDVAVELFSSVPEVAWVEANFRPELWEETGVDFAFFVDGEVSEVNRRLVSLVCEFMKETGIGAELIVLTSRIDPYHRIRGVIYSREAQQEELEPRRASR